MTPLATVLHSRRTGVVHGGALDAPGLGVV